MTSRLRPGRAVPIRSQWARLADQCHHHSTRLVEGIAPRMASAVLNDRIAGPELNSHAVIEFKDASPRYDVFEVDGSSGGPAGREFRAAWVRQICHAPEVCPSPECPDTRLEPQLPMNEEVLTRGLEPPRVSPYGPEPYASAIPPRERLRWAACKLPVAGSTASANHRPRLFRARDSTVAALRFLPNDRRRSA